VGVFGGFGAAIIFGALVAFQAVSYFLTGPESPGSILGMTVAIVVLLAMVLAMP
jgi:hypothetical protein